MSEAIVRLLLTASALTGAINCGMFYKASSPAFGKNYYVNTEELDLIGATETCSAFGGSLVTIESPMEENFLENAMAEEGRTKMFWIMSRMVNSFTWKSVLFPETTPQGSCTGIAVVYTYEAAPWIGARCDKRYQSICEVKSSASSVIGGRLASLVVVTLFFRIFWWQGSRKP